MYNGEKSATARESQRQFRMVSSDKWIREEKSRCEKLADTWKVQKQTNKQKNTTTNYNDNNNNNNKTSERLNSRYIKKSLS